MMRRAASRIRWYSLSVSVSAGATVTLSPVCTPIGSTFSIEQTTTKLSAASRITSSSYSFQPSTDSSTRIWCTGLSLEAARRQVAELLDVERDAPAHAAQRERRPDDRPGSRPGRPARAPPRAIRARPLSGTSRPIDSSASRKRSRSSATWIASRDAPISRTPWRASVPSSASSTARLSAVCPPTVGNTASGRSRAMIFSTIRAVSGST